jgi:nucleotide-binding universal stress UspA family protein
MPRAASSRRCPARPRSRRFVAELIFASATADLLVIGTHEPTGVFHGILPLQLAAASTCPVVVVPAGWAPRNGAVVIGVDDDDTSEFALAFAAAEAVRIRASLKLVHTWSIPYPLMINPYGLTPDAVDISQDAHQLVLDKAVEFVAREYPDLIVHPILRQGSPATELVDVAETAELLVVGTHRRGVIPAMLLGSVSHNVLVNVPCPVVVAPHPDEKHDEKKEEVH